MPTLPATVRNVLDRGVAIPAMPLALTSERRLDERTCLHEMQDDEESTDTTVAVVERVERLELVVRHARGDDGIDGLRVIVRHPLEQVPHLVLQILTGWSGDETGVLHPCTVVPSDHHLDVTESARVLRLSGRAADQTSLQVRQHADGQGALVPGPGEGVLGGSHVVEDLAEVGVRLLLALVRSEHRFQRRERPLQR